MLRPPLPSSASHSMQLEDMSNDRLTMQDDDAMVDATDMDRPPIVLLSQQLPSQPHHNDILQQLYHSYQAQASHQQHQYQSGELNHHGGVQELSQQQQQQMLDTTASYRRKRSLSAPLLLKAQVNKHPHQQEQQRFMEHQESIVGRGTDHEDMDMDQYTTQSPDQEDPQVIRRTTPAATTITTTSYQPSLPGTTTGCVAASETSLIPQPIIDYSKIYANRETFWASLPRYHRHKLYASISHSRPGHTDSTTSTSRGVNASCDSSLSLSKSSIPRVPMARSVRCFYKLTPSQQWAALSSPTTSMSSSASSRPNASDLLSYSPWDAALGISRIMLRSTAAGITKTTQRSRLPIHIRHVTSRTHRRPAICVRPPSTMQQPDELLAIRQVPPSSSSPSTLLFSGHTESLEQEHDRENSDELHPHHTTYDHDSTRALRITSAGKRVVGGPRLGGMDHSAASSFRNRLWTYRRGGLLNVVAAEDGSTEGGGSSAGSTTSKSNVDRLVEELSRWQV